MTSDQNENVNETEQPTSPDATPAPDAQESPAPESPAPESPTTPDATPTDEAAATEEFSAMLDEAENATPADAKSGDQVEGTIIQIGEADAFVDCGLRNELPLALTELKGDDGELTHKVGDRVKGVVQEADGQLKLTLALDARGGGPGVLATAFADGTPVRGKVRDTNKGGFSIDLGGTRAFCPFSQIDLRRADDPTVFVGNEYEFKILEFSEDGRNIVVSRRALLQAQREEAATQTRETLALGDTREGVVTRLVPFGAFVDIGGVEGLVHISQISHQRVGHPGDVLREGQEVKVKVLEIQNLGMGRSERISLSIKALASDPWPETAASLVPGTDVSGRVTRLVDFGVFVELQPGIEGLVHISELANRRIIHPREVLNEDEQIEVKILDVDLDRRRISLSRRQSSSYDGD